MVWSVTIFDCGDESDIRSAFPDDEDFGMEDGNEAAEL